MTRKRPSRMKVHICYLIGVESFIVCLTLGQESFFCPLIHSEFFSEVLGLIFCDFRSDFLGFLSVILGLIFWVFKCDFFYFFRYDFLGVLSMIFVVFKVSKNCSEILNLLQCACLILRPIAFQQNKNGSLVTMSHVNSRKSLLT